MNYWNLTNEALARNGGRGPTCPDCNREMTPQDDHGRFVCLFCPGKATDGTAIPQIDVSGMDDATKARIAPIHRLDAPPTAREADLLRQMLQGLEAMDTADYSAAVQRVDEERSQK